MSPEWLPRVKKGYTIGGISLEDIIKSNKQADIITLHLPPNYKFGELDDFKLGSVDLNGFTLFFAIPITEKTKEKVKFSHENNQKKKAADEGGVVLREEVVLPDDYYKGVANLKTGFDIWKNNDKEWERELKLYLKDKLLPKINLPKEKINKLLDDESMETWKAVFTHDTYNPNIGKNYEQLETLGDFVMSTSFVDHVIQETGNINPSDMTEIKKKILSSRNQSIIAIYLGLHLWIRTRAKPVEANFEDMLEAFFGAILVLGNSKLKMLGYPMASMFMDIILQLFIFDFEKIRKDPKTYIVQIFDRMKWNKPIETAYVDDDGMVIVKVELTSEAIADILKLTNFQVRSFLGSGKGKQKKEASQLAYENARKELDKFGIDQDFAVRIAEERRFSDPTFKEYRNKLLGVLQKMGYLDLEFGMKKKKESTTIIIYGIKSDGEKDFLYSRIEDGNLKGPVLYVQTIKDYLETL